MTRVSDVPEFCQAVERGGGLPFLALALMRGEEVRDVLVRTRELMGADRGVSVSSVSSRWSCATSSMRLSRRCVRRLRLSRVVARIRQPDWRRGESVPTSTCLLRRCWIYSSKDGARRFIFEGRECGGHVGPRSSFVLWESAIQVLTEAGLPPQEASKVHVLFAGGISDGLSGAMISALSQPLVELGMKVGVLLGTAYLFTEEAVSTGAILDVFQDVALDASQTVIVESGPGHAIRCVPNPYTDSFEAEKRGWRARDACRRTPRAAGTIEHRPVADRVQGHHSGPRTRWPSTIIRDRSPRKISVVKACT